MSFSSPWLLLLLLPMLGGTIWAWAGRRHGLESRRRQISLALRLLIFTALILALAGLTWQRPQQDQTVAFVADLSASTAPAQDAETHFIDAALRARTSSDRAALVAFGREPLVEQPPASLTGLKSFESIVDPDYSNLDGALGLGGALLPPDTRHREVLLSDGQENLGDAVSEARLLRAEGIRVDVAPVVANPGPEVRVDGVDVPSSLHVGEQFPLTIRLTSTVATQASVLILQDGQVVKSDQATIQPGQGTLSYTLTVKDAGVHTYRAIVQPLIDTLPQNNDGSAFANVVGPPQVLVVEGYPHFGDNVVASLHAAHIQTTTVSGFAVSSDLATLQRYAAVVLVDVPADEMGPDVEGALRSFVGDLGHGLVVIGGTNSYGVGNYGSTPLEEAMPVRMDLPKRKDLPTAAVVLIIESLESETNVNISKRAGEGVVGLLNPQDKIAVSDTNPGFVVPLQNVTNKAAIDNQIANMDPADPFSYAPSLQQAYQVLRNAKAQTKHIILLGDGDATDNYQPLITMIHNAGISVSTIETNAVVPSDYQTMKDIARWGGGKYYPADNVSTIPQIFLKVARTVAHSSIIEGKFFPVQDAPSPILSGITAVPPLLGYVVTTPKPLSTIVLSSPKSDPILAQWQYGLGRSVAWTSDSQGRWTTGWLANPATKKIWASMVNWVLPPPQSGSLSLTAGVTGGLATIGVDTLDNTSYRSVTAHVVGPDGKAENIALQPTAPNHYEAQVLASSEGAFLVHVDARVGGKGPDAGQVRSVSGGLVVPYAPDYRDSGPDTVKLAAIATAGGGSLLTNPRQAWADNLPSVDAPTSLQTLLLLLALLLLPIDVAARRLVLGREDWQAVVAALPGRRRAASGAPALPALAPLAAMRTQRAARQQTSVTSEESPGMGAAGLPTATATVPAAAAITSAPMPTGSQSGRATTIAPSQHGDATLGLQAEPAPVAAAAKPVPAHTPTAVAPEETAASKLLEAKRRRRSQ